MSGSRRLAVYTAVIGDYDVPLAQPADPDADYFFFCDRPRDLPPPWQLRVVDAVEATACLTARRIKAQPHHYLPDHEISLWIDGNIFLKAPIAGAVDDLLAGHLLALFAHDISTNLGEEAIDVVKLGKADAETVWNTLAAHWDPDLDLPLLPFPVTTILLRRHRDPAVVAAMDMWWDSIRTLCHRDQLSLVPALGRAGVPWHTLPGLTVYDNQWFGSRPHTGTPPPTAVPDRETFFQLQHFSEAFRPGQAAWRRAMTALLARIAPPDQVTSVLDVGCGIGSVLGLPALADREVMGVEGPWLRDHPLRVAPEQIHRQDLLRARLDLGRRFDLVLSLDLGQYLPESLAPLLVETLCRHGDRVLFAAGVPEQTTDARAHALRVSDWASLFAAHGFVATDVRASVWNEPALPLSFRQAAILYEHRPGTPTAPVPDLIHPDAHRREIRRLNRQVARASGDQSMATKLLARLRTLGGRGLLESRPGGLMLTPLPEDRPPGP